jgi:hypothetical protein
MPPRSEANLEFKVTCHGDTVAQGVLKAREGSVPRVKKQ